MWSVGGVILTGETEVLGEDAVPVPLCATNLTWTDLGSNLRLRGERPATDCLSDGTAFEN